jgi:hypothetical protein
MIGSFHGPVRDPSTRLLEKLPGSRLPAAEHPRHQPPYEQRIGTRAEQPERQVVVDVIGEARAAVPEILEAMLVQPARKGPGEHAVDEERRCDDALGLDPPCLSERRRPQPDDDLDLVALGERKRSADRHDRHRARGDACRVAGVEMEGEHVGDRSAHHTGAFEERHGLHGGGTADVRSSGRTRQ